MTVEQGRATGWAKRFFDARDGTPACRATGGHPVKMSSCWRQRGYLPHFDKPGVVQGVTFRLADAVPAEKVADWKRELGFLDGMSVRGRLTGEEIQRQDELHRRIAKYEDAGCGECLFGQPEIASLMADSLGFFDGERYVLLAWCVMPNHVHAVLETLGEYGVGDIVRSWKRFSAVAVNRRLGRLGTPLWQRDFYDRAIRDSKHLRRAVDYVERNPVAAGLVKSPEDWLWGSAGMLPARKQSNSKPNPCEQHARAPGSGA